MDPALTGLVGIVVGALLGGTGKYFVQRRDAWIKARASGLLLLDDVQALCAAARTDFFLAETSMGVKSWEAHRETLAGFRRGTYPNGFKAPEWLALADCFASLRRLDAVKDCDRNDTWWAQVTGKLAEAKRLLSGFEKDPPVLRYVVFNWFRSAFRWVLSAFRFLVKRRAQNPPPPPR